jgi:DNA repair exonuclease SbcCD ATPase subunit
VTGKIDDILSLLSRMDKLSTNHLQTKYNLSMELKEIAEKEKKLKEEILELKKNIAKLKSDSKPERKMEDITKLIMTINDLENEIAKNELQNSEIESELTLKKTEHGILANKIQMLQNEKEQLEITCTQKKAERSRAKKDSAKVQRERGKLNRLRKQIELKEEQKKNLESATQTISLVEQVIIASSPISGDKSREFPQEVSQEIRELIISSKQKFDEAQAKFSSTDLTPYLLDADKSFRLAVKAFILLNSSLRDETIEQTFSEQVFELVNFGLVLNTRHLKPVEAMLQKLEKGVEIAPLASFANEVRDYFTENLSLIGITRAILELD